MAASLVLAALALGAVVLLRPYGVAEFGEDHTTAVAFGALIAATAAGAAASFALLLRR
jgi:hypothetical protein